MFCSGGLSGLCVCFFCFRAGEGGFKIVYMVLEVKCMRTDVETAPRMGQEHGGEIWQCRNVRSWRYVWRRYGQ